MLEWILRAAGVAAVTLLLDHLVRRRTLRAPPGIDVAGDVVIRYPVLTAVLRGAFGALLATAGVIVLVTPFEDVPIYGRLLGGAMFLLPATIGVWWSATMLSCRFALRHDGIEAHQSGRQSLFTWDDVRAIECNDYGPLWKWMTIRGAAQTIRVPLDVAGSPAFYAAARERVGADRWVERFPPFERGATALPSAAGDARSKDR